MFRNTKIATSLLAVLLTFCLLQFVTEALGFWSLRSTYQQVGTLSQIAINDVNAVNEATQRLMDARINLSRAGTRMVGGGAKPTDIIDHSVEQIKFAETAFARFASDTPTADGAAAAKALSASFKVYLGALKELVDFLNADNIKAYLDQPTQSMQDKYLADRQAYVQYASGVGAASLQSIDDSYTLFRLVASGIAVLLCAVTLLMFLGVRRTIVRPLENACRHFERIAAGNLGEHIPAYGKNEIGRLYASIKQMQSSVASAMFAVRESSDSIHTGANEIAAGNTDLSARTEQQAAALEETAASLQELTSTVKQNNELAGEANRLSADALAATSRGNETVDQVVAKIRSIAESSSKIRDIVSVIDGIAFQTNILALNAAVEAARAGEQGKGFAVVAGEVRSLAQRSAQSAKEIAALIGTSVSEINSGVEMVGHAGEAMHQVSDSISRVAQMMKEIRDASQEQQSGIEQINIAVAQIDGMTQQNAALVEEAAAAALSLHEQTTRLNDAVGVFHFGSQRPDDVIETQPRLAAQALPALQRG